MHDLCLTILTLFNFDKHAIMQYSTLKPLSLDYFKTKSLYKIKVALSVHEKGLEIEIVLSQFPFSDFR